jgi:hypothetical protein
VQQRHVTAQELTVETYFPMDAATAAWLGEPLA